MSSSSDSDSYDSDLSIDPQKTIPKLPKLERQICLDDTRSLANFLKLSRLNVDDSIRTRLNTSINHHESKSKQSILSFERPDQRQSPCLPLIKQLIFPQWYERLDAIKYCSNEVSKMAVEVKQDPKNNMSEEDKNKLLRVDPYAMRDIEEQQVRKNEEVEELSTKWANEEQIEKIIRDRTEEVIYDLCDLPDYNVKNEFLKYSQEMSKKN